MPPKSSSSTSTSSRSDDKLTNRIKQLHKNLQYTIDKIQEENKSRNGSETPDELKSNAQSIDKIIQELKKVQSSSTLNDSNEKLSKKERYKLFTDWLQKEAPMCGYNNYWQIDTSSSKQPGGGTGLVATRSIEQHQPIISIPRHVMVTSENVMSSQSPHNTNNVVYDIIKHDELCYQMPSMAIVMQVWYDRYVAKESSYYWPYIQTLPDENELYLPMFSSYNELVENLQSSHTLFDIFHLQRLTVRHYLHMISLIKQANSKRSPNQQIPSPTFKQFQWSVGGVMSRQNQIPATRSNVTSCMSLTPAMDLCNHKGSGYISTHFKEDTQQMETYSMEKLHEGDPILLYYGDRANSKLYMFMGFVDMNHQKDAVEFVLKLPPSEDTSLNRIRSLMITKAGLEVNQALPLPLPIPSAEFDEQHKARRAGAAGDEQKSNLNPDDATDDDDGSLQERTSNNAAWHGMMHWLRCAVMSKEDAPAALKQQAQDKNNVLTHPVSRTNEPQAFQLLKSMIQLELIPYETTLEHDEEVYGNAEKYDALTHAQRVALQMRLSEKRIYHKGIQDVSKWATTLPTFQIDAL